MKPTKYIRTQILKMTQSEFAGGISRPQPTVSRWETGELVPDINDLNSIRELVRRKGKRWSDKWIFEVPAEKDGEAAA